MVEGNAVDILLENRRIKKIVPRGTGIGERIIDYQQKVFISSGWIDIHVHAFPEFDPHGDEIDEVDYKTGVTTIIDAGSTCSDCFSDLVESSKSAQNNVFAFLNISQIGLKRIDELANLHWLLGRFSVGDIANLTLFTVEDESISLIDSKGEVSDAKQNIIVKGVVINGEFIEC